MNFKDFKKVKDDKNCATLMHPMGHEIRIAKGKLSPQMRASLDKLPIHAAEGADTMDTPHEDTPVEGEQAQASPAHGVNININASPQPQAAPQVQAAPQPVAPQPAPVAPAPQDQGLAAGQAPAPQAAAPSAEPAPHDGLGADAAAQEQAAVAPQPDEQAAAPEAAAPMAPGQEVKQHLTTQDAAFQHDLENGHITPETYSDLFAKKSTLGKIGTMFGLLMSGVGSGLTGQPNALLEMMNNEIKNDLQAQMQSKTNAQNFISLNQKQQMQGAQIKQMDVQNKLTQTQQDIAKSELEFKKERLPLEIKKLDQEGKLNEAQSRSLNVEANTKAYALANMQMNRAALHTLADQVNKLPAGSPQRVQAEQTLATMAGAVNSENFNIADRAAAQSALLSYAGGGDKDNPEASFQSKNKMLRLSGNEGLAKDMEGKHFPGLQGQASIPLNQSDHEQINSGITFQQQLDRFMDWTKKHSGDLNPKDRKEGEAMAAGLQGAYRNATNGGVYKAGEQEFISKIIDSTPTKFFNSIRVLPSLQAVKRDSAAQLDQFVKSKGFKGYKGESSGTIEPQYKMVNGVKYMRGPNGEAIKVK